ncbi:hypothetical protein BD410DRAFT_791361 [Rickenella mellea]|uniref:Uncharacterized protein n=1 Tax=Rickenella mellea TaxID=50990 RepID=A0A4Y7PX48_9AGAM|nr:hypothetical protein BD410DRAFT_791361 [Rickenella mellea]
MQTSPEDFHPKLTIRIPPRHLRKLTRSTVDAGPEPKRPEPLKRKLSQTEIIPSVSRSSTPKRLKRQASPTNPAGEDVPNTVAIGDQSLPVTNGNPQISDRDGEFTNMQAEPMQTMTNINTSERSCFFTTPPTCSPDQSSTQPKRKFSQTEIHPYESLPISSKRVRWKSPPVEPASDHPPISSIGLESLPKPLDGASGDYNFDITVGSSEHANGTVAAVSMQVVNVPDPSVTNLHPGDIGGVGSTGEASESTNVVDRELPCKRSADGAGNEQADTSETNDETDCSSELLQRVPPNNPFLNIVHATNATTDDDAPASYQRQIRHLPPRLLEPLDTAAAHNTGRLLNLEPSAHASTSINFNPPSKRKTAPAFMENYSPPKRQRNEPSTTELPPKATAPFPDRSLASRIQQTEGLISSAHRSSDRVGPPELESASVDVRSTLAQIPEGAAGATRKDLHDEEWVPSRVLQVNAPPSGLSHCGSANDGVLDYHTQKVDDSIVTGHTAQVVQLDLNNNNSSALPGASVAEGKRISHPSLTTDGGSLHLASSEPGDCGGAEHEQMRDIVNCSRLTIGPSPTSATETDLRRAPPKRREDYVEVDDEPPAGNSSRNFKEYPSSYNGTLSERRPAEGVSSDVSAEPISIAAQVDGPTDVQDSTAPATKGDIDKVFNALNVTIGHLENIAKMKAATVQHEDRAAAGGTDSRPRRTHRSPTIVLLQKRIRTHAQKLMGREDDSCPIPEPVSEQIIKAYGKKPVGEPTVENFGLDLLGSVVSPWNQKAARVFRKDFIATYGSVKGVANSQLEKMFMTHLRTIKAKYVKQQNPERSPEDVANLSRQAQYNRRAITFENRLSACKTFKPLHGCVDALESLGPDGMSGDESETHSSKRGSGEGDDKRYIIIQQPWRSPNVTEWLRPLDLVHLSSRFDSMGNATRGKWPRRRVPSRRVNNDSRPVPGLPRAFYNPDWLATLEVDALEDLNIQEQRFNLSHSPEILQFANRYRAVTGPNTKPEPALPRPVQPVAGPSRQVPQSTTTPRQVQPVAGPSRQVPQSTTTPRPVQPVAEPSQPAPQSTTTASGRMEEGWGKRHKGLDGDDSMDLCQC